jgi:hypothetical protein
LGLALAAFSLPARAEEPKRPDSAVAFMTGAAVFLVGMGVGGTILATSSNRSQDNAAWLTMNASFTLAPLAGHATAGEWGRGLLFSAPPALTLAGTGTLFAIEPDAVRHGNRIEQRWLWGFFTAGLVTSAIGVIDGAFAGERAHSVALVPQIGPGSAGMMLQGTL